MRRNGVVGAAVALVLGACGGGPGPAPIDPVTLTQTQIEELSVPNALDQCAAFAVLQQRTLNARRLNGVAAGTSLRSRIPSSDGTPNLTQVSAWASDAHLFRSSAQAQAAAGTLSRAQAERQADIGMRGFDEAMGRIDHLAPSGARTRTGRGDAGTEVAYAQVWHAYFNALHGNVDEGSDAARLGQILDWLTTNSLNNASLLTDYYEEFLDAQEHACGAKE